MIATTLFLLAIAVLLEGLALVYLVRRVRQLHEAIIALVDTLAD